MNIFRKFIKCWGKSIQLESAHPSAKIGVKWPSGPAYEAMNPFRKFIEFCRLNIEVQHNPPPSKFHVNWPNGSAYEVKSSFGKFTEFCRQNIESQRYGYSSSSNFSPISPANSSSGFMNMNQSNLSHINPSSGMPMINSTFDSRGNTFGSNGLSSIHNPSSIGGISNPNGF